ncbi:LOW QUALITY PROTEIN: hypothetical protein CH63R_03411 [Colletotrichum higginsianum IMI 349063]|uniref:Uncharacterized protein n=1 Tax=Colletotrichum higginsianum (strain IMI 349063) TaxID=759273 RepID=A0A1B7YRL7_COLHI|nr:LOW QUALITY PROTEIN: hypothetical protein CH63R_03411 [Colletotrichum higginsianum IMI 349063]OBR14685.1 LOW QUALITY PROTEIN: hypothetical protein CH63R_03411 [Colletotrichum higginsianum IMI 349063]
MSDRRCHTYSSPRITDDLHPFLCASVPVQFLSACLCGFVWVSDSVCLAWCVHSSVDFQHLHARNITRPTHHPTMGNKPRYLESMPEYVTPASG